MVRPLQLARLALAPLSRSAGLPRLLPLNLTISVTNRCSSRCRTCRVWTRVGEELGLDELRRVFESLRRVPAWVTVSGGDQFLREDLPEIVGLIRQILQPTVINIPMNCVLPRRIERLLPEIARRSRGGQLVLNLSVDDIGARHDDIRGVPGNFEKVRAVFAFVRNLQRAYNHVVVGLHTVISRFNVDRIPAVAEELRSWNPDSYITEVSENRVELGTEHEEIAPDLDEYLRALSYLKSSMRAEKRLHPIGRMVRALRLEYYDLAGEIVRRKEQVIPCYAGWVSGHLAPDGHVWGCCVRAESFGNVRDVGYEFARVWYSRAAHAFRRSVVAKSCACPLASACYTNMLLAPTRLLRVSRNLVL